MSDECRPQGAYVAIVAEKPKAAEKIALSISPQVKKCLDGKVPYWIARRDGRSLVIVPSVGHMFKLETRRRGFPVFEYHWEPMVESSFQRAVHGTLKRLLSGASEYISACDYDVEGSVICYKIIEAYGDLKRAKRMKFSSLTRHEIQRAFSSLGPLDVNMVEAGLARHEVDWIWGINVSRAIMHAAASSGKRMRLSAGRVQSPTLVEAARRWDEINLHVPTPQISLRALLSKAGQRFEARLTGSLSTMREAKMAQSLLQGGELVVKEYEEVVETIAPPPAYNLGDLQKEASRIYGMSPAKTQRIAEDLYLDALISYPRTNSQKLPASIDFRRILMGLSSIKEYAKLAGALLQGGRLSPVQGSMDDPAHPAIHPTGEPPRGLDEDHRKIYDLIVRRFMAAFAPDAKVERRRALLADQRGLTYVASGISVVSEGWFAYYPFSRPEERRMPRLREGERLIAEGARISVSWSRANQSISSISLLRWMESVGIGTEATRARIIETLYKRGYLSRGKGATYVTGLGEAVAILVSELFPNLSSPALTRELERKLEEVREGKRSRAEVVREAAQIVEKLIREYEGTEKSGRARQLIGRALGIREGSRGCLVCGRDADGDLCDHHERALRALKEALPKISQALEISEKEALEEVSKRAGRWVAEVARYLLNSGRSVTRA